jgi:hypothetical protein
VSKVPLPGAVGRSLVAQREESLHIDVLMLGIFKDMIGDDSLSGPSRDTGSGRWISDKHSVAMPTDQFLPLWTDL